VGGTRWLDLFAGTGQVGIEALSRNADWVVFVDSSRLAVKTVSENLKRTRLLDKADTIHADAFNYLRQFSGEAFDVIYVAPPQYRNLWDQALLEIDKSPGCFLKSDGMVIIQIDPKEYEPIQLKTLELFDNRRYGNTMLLFFEVPYSSTNSMAH
jgi:16S rRNA (guanine966-N2)-methyltransferase